MLTALDQRLHQLEDFPTPYHQFPSPHHLGNTETSAISWRYLRHCSTNTGVTRELGSTGQQTHRVPYPTVPRAIRLGSSVSRCKSTWLQSELLPSLAGDTAAEHHGNRLSILQYITVYHSIPQYTVYHSIS